MKSKPRSPIKDKPLRLPGQGLREERERIWEDKVEPALLVALFFVFFAALEWARSVWKLPPMPWLVSAVAVALVGFAAWRIFKFRPQMRRLRQGLEGEVAVGQFLDRLREQRYQVFHDVVAEGFNIDHVLVGPAGVFTVETKTWSKTEGGDAVIHFDGTRLLVNGVEPERDVITQAASQAKWLARNLAESTGRKLAVQAVVVFPGWYVDARPGSQRGVWVMEPKGLPAYLARQQAMPAAEDMRLAAYHLSRYVRAKAREAD